MIGFNEHGRVTRQHRSFGLNRRIVLQTTCFLAITCAHNFALVTAKDTPDKDAVSTKEAAHSLGGVANAMIPDCVAKLKLTSEQQSDIKEIIHKYDGSLGTVWKQFGDRYLQTVTMESSLLAAIEDNFTEPQRQQVRDQRHKTAQMEKTAALTNEKPNTATGNPANTVEDEIAGVGVTLTSEQEAAADKVQEKYRAHLRSLNRDIQGLHTRLLSLEADKLVAIEKILTKDQLAQLRLHRQNAPEAPKASLERSVTKAE